MLQASLDAWSGVETLTSFIRDCDSAPQVKHTPGFTVETLTSFKRDCDVDQDVGVYLSPSRNFDLI